MIKFNTTDNNSQDESTNYWFLVNGEDWALSELRGEFTLLDCDGCPTLECNDNDGVKDALLEFTLKSDHVDLKFLHAPIEYAFFR